MMLSVAAMLLIGLQTAASARLSDDSLELVTPEVAAARVAACGFRKVRSQTDGDLQEEVVEVLEIRSATELQLRCAARASLDLHYFVMFPARVDRAYQTLYWRMSHERDKADARAWLAERGLLARVPRQGSKRSDEAAFTRALEAVCGPRAAGTLRRVGDMATIAPETLSGGKLDDDTLRCLVNVAVASGSPFGFIGNEQYVRPR